MTEDLLSQMSDGFDWFVCWRTRKRVWIYKLLSLQRVSALGKLSKKTFNIIFNILAEQWQLAFTQFRGKDFLMTSITSNLRRDAFRDTAVHRSRLKLGYNQQLIANKIHRNDSICINSTRCSRTFCVFHVVHQRAWTRQYMLCGSSTRNKWKLLSSVRTQLMRWE